MKKMLVIDGNSILNRAYYGIRPLTNKDGLYTHAVYGMINIIWKYIESISPDFCVVAFDLKAPTFRHKMYSEYKANRKGMPEELAVQLPYAKKSMEALGLKVITMEGYEADDILGTVSKNAGAEGIHSYILTGDRDSLQLIDDNISVLLVKTKETLEYTREVFFEAYGVYPDVFVDVKALMGDSSDNIPGVAGIGEKTAFKLISDFGNMDNLYASYENSALSASIKQKLENGKELAILSRELAKIDVYVPIKEKICDCEFKGLHNDDLYDLFTELEFFGFIKKFKLNPVQKNKTSVQTISKGNISECSDKSPDANELCENTLCVFADEKKIEVFDGKELLTFDVFDISKAAKAIENKFLICHDYKKMYKLFVENALSIGECVFDTMLASYVLNSGRSKYDLDVLLSVYFGAEQKSLSAISLYELYVVLKKQIDEQNCHDLLFNIEIPLARVLADMELTGFAIDVAGIEKYGEELAIIADELQERIYSMAGEEFNINSPKQLGEVLFEKMGLPKSKKTKTGYSTDAETLQKLASKHAIIEDILEYRQVTKLRSTYAEGLLKAADKTGRIHSAFNQTGTATGRLSSAEPNLQNIPIRTEMGRKFRKYFIPSDKNHVIIDADYSQIELRLLAHVSGDQTMRDAFLSGEDIHTRTASTVFGVDASQVTTELRKRAKAVNFGIVYGIGEHSLSEDLGISRTDAKNYIQSYFAGFPKVSEYLENIKSRARDDGYVVTEFGRKRYIPELSASNKNVQHFGERVAMNSPIQGTAADIIKIAMVKVSAELKKFEYDARLILQVHDELIIEACIDCADKVKELLVDCMEKAVDFSVPLNVEASIGNNWYDAK